MPSPIKAANSAAIFYRILALSLIAFVFAVTVFRAVSQPIAHDEALTFEWFLDAGVYKLLSYNSTNHVLFTLLAKPFVKFFGPTELSLRAASLIGAAGYLGFAYLLSRKLFGEGMLFLASVALLCLNPQIMDFMAAARGYGLGLAFLLAALYVLASRLERGIYDPDDAGWHRDCAIASILLAFSVAAVLTSIIPAAALTLSFFAAAVGRSVPRAKDLGRRALRSYAQYFVLPGAVAGLFVMWPFLIQARPWQFLFLGVPRAADALRDFFNASFLYKWTGDIYSTSLGAVPPAAGSWQLKVSDLGVYALLPLMACFVLGGLIAVSRPHERSPQESTRESRDREMAHVRLLGIAAIAALAFIIGPRVLLHVKYPVSRTCLYFIPLFTLASLLIGRELSFRFPRYALKLAGAVVIPAVLFDYAASLNTKYFRYNEYDAISRQLFFRISDDARAHGLMDARVGGTWWYEPEITFYPRRYGATWMEPYDVKDRSHFWESPGALPPAQYDYFVFTPACDPGLSPPTVRTIFHDPAIGITVIAKSR